MKKYIQVIANPKYVFPHDPDFCPGFVGARVDAEKTQQLSSAETGAVLVGGVGVTISTDGNPRVRQKTVFKYSKEPQVVPDSKHYRTGVRAGALLPAGEETARRCGVKFTPPNSEDAA